MCSLYLQFSTTSLILIKVKCKQNDSGKSLPVHLDRHPHLEGISNKVYPGYLKAKAKARLKLDNNKSKFMYKYKVLNF